MGVLDPENVFEAVCAGFKNKPNVCKVHKLGGEHVGGVSAFRLMVIISGLVMLNVVLILCYRRYSKKEVNEQMQMHINSAVS
jgi:hypothetical protein